jgi:carbamoyltransferase
VQAVSRQSEPFVHMMLLAIKRHIGFPIVLNTSFNVNKEPIVETPLDAVQTFLKTEIDTLVINNYMVDKPFK